MEELIQQYFFIFAFSMFKFIFGPVLGITSGLSLVETVIFTVFGMMATVINLTFLGSDLRKRILNKLNSNKRLFTKRNRRIVAIWRKYGVFGITFLTPVLFSPIVGTVIVVSFGEKRSRIILYMLFSAVFWSIILTLLGSQLITFIQRYNLLEL